jgi:hypothetical protein
MIDISDDVQSAIVDLFLSPLRVTGNCISLANAAPQLLPDGQKISCADFKMYDLEKNGIPIVVVESYGYESLSYDAYKYIDGEYVKIANLLSGYSFYMDDKNRLILYEVGVLLHDRDIIYSYIDISANELLRDIVYYDKDVPYNYAVPSESYFNKINNVRFTLDYMGAIPNPELLDKSVKQIAAIDSSAIEEKIRRFFDEYPSKLKAEGKVLLFISASVRIFGEIIICNNPIVEHDGEFYISAQSIVNLLGITPAYDDPSRTITYSSNSHEATILTEKIPDSGNPPRIIDDVLMIPATFNSNYFPSEYFPELNIICIFDFYRHGG